MSQAAIHSRRRTLVAAFDRRAAHTLRNASAAKSTYFSTFSMVFAVVALIDGWISIAAVFIGLIELTRLSRPHNYPFKFTRRVLNRVRMAYIAVIVIGIVGVIINRVELQPIANWLNS